MAANFPTPNNTPEIPARTLTAYDLVIGILALFSLTILIPPTFGNVSPVDAAVFTSLENALCAVFLFDVLEDWVQAADLIK